MGSSILEAVNVAATVGIAGMVIAGIWMAVRTTRAGGRVGGVATALVAVWASAALLLGSRSFFATNPGTKVPFIGLAVALPVAAGVVAYRSSQTVRDLAGVVPLHLLVGVQLYRVGGLFLIAWAQGELPPHFALPAGLGDIAVGLAAPAVVYALYRRHAGATQMAALWNVLGIADLAVAVGAGFLTAPSIFQQLALDSPNYAITRFPLVLIPAFLVPVSILLHFFALKHPGAREREMTSAFRSRPVAG